MFYHAALWFDYHEFSREASLLNRAVEKDDFLPLAQRASAIANSVESGSFFLTKYGVGPLTPDPLSVEGVASSPYRNSELGRWFFLVMSSWLQPSPVSIGYAWVCLSEALRQVGWPDERLELLFHGLPTGLLVSPQASSEQVSSVTHNDPYWRWVRPLYSFDQGGWLSIEACQDLYDDLLRSEALLSAMDPPSVVGPVQQQVAYWRESLRSGYQNSVQMFQLALEHKLGLYLITLWDWDEEIER